MWPSLWPSQYVLVQALSAREKGDYMLDQGQGPAWIVFLLWFGLPLLLFFLGLTFTG